MLNFTNQPGRGQPAENALGGVDGNTQPRPQGIHRQRNARVVDDGVDQFLDDRCSVTNIPPFFVPHVTLAAAKKARGIPFRSVGNATDENGHQQTLSSLTSS
jgi:hypothetical protein